MPCLLSVANKTHTLHNEKKAPHRRQNVAKQQARAFICETIRDIQPSSQYALGQGERSEEGVASEEKSEGVAGLRIHVAGFHAAHGTDTPSEARTAKRLGLA